MGRAASKLRREADRRSDAITPVDAVPAGSAGSAQGPAAGLLQPVEVIQQPVPWSAEAAQESHQFPQEPHSPAQEQHQLAQGLHAPTGSPREPEQAHSAPLQQTAAEELLRSAEEFHEPAAALLKSAEALPPVLQHVPVAEQPSVVALPSDGGHAVLSVGAPQANTSGEDGTVGGVSLGTPASFRADVHDGGGGLRPSQKDTGCAASSRGADDAPDGSVAAMELECGPAEQCQEAPCPDVRIADDAANLEEAAADIQLTASSELTLRLAECIENEEWDESLAILEGTEAIDPSGRTPDWGYSLLRAAAEAGSLRVCQLLLSRKADVNAKDTNSMTALMGAVVGGDNGDLVELLLNAKAEAACCTDDGFTALSWATRLKHESAIRVLRLAGMEGSHNPF
mmetsp:Transcript_11210/g.28409  ORF Transcript_11210/g.28409 Transcript_11210/m.28409 type:complete len:398 (+) Transcript_11210:37-1230(+)